MSNVSGSIAVNVEFRDSTTSSNVQSLQTIALRETTEYTTGKVIVASGTAGTASVYIGDLGSSFRNSAGSIVSLTGLSRISFRWNGPANRTRNLIESGDFLFKICSQNGEIATSSVPNSPYDLQLEAGGSGNTGTYTIVLYGT